MAMGGGSKKGGSTAEPYINVTPLIDVLLVLLIIFIVITPMLNKGITVDMAKAKNPSKMQAADKESNPRHWHHLHALQNTFKILINSFYGYLGFAQGHFADFDAAARPASDDAHLGAEQQLQPILRRARVHIGRLRRRGRARRCARFDQLLDQRFRLAH